MFSLDKEIAMVTGASGNLGPIWIETLLDAGAVVFAIDHPDAKPTQNLQSVLSGDDRSRVELARADIRDRSALEDACSRCMDKFGVPSVLVNNAGIDRPPANSDTGVRLEEIPFEENREIFEVNTLGLFLAAQVIGTRMVQAGRGSIINIGSLYAGVALKGS